MEEKIDTLIKNNREEHVEFKKLNAEEHNSIKEALKSKADNWVEEAVREIHKTNKMQLYALIGVLVSITGFLFCKLMGWC